MTTHVSKQENVTKSQEEKKSININRYIQNPDVGYKGNDFKIIVIIIFKIYRKRHIASFY